MAKEHQPDVVLLDIRMPDMDGLDALERIHRASPEIKVVMLSTYDNPTYVARAVALGASDYVLKGACRQDILNTIRAAAGGQGPSNAGELLKVAGAMRREVSTMRNDVSLTAREMQVLRHLALGLSNKEIGRSLAISIETVKEHVQNILRKVSVADRTQAAVWAIKTGLDLTPRTPHPSRRRGPIPPSAWAHRLLLPCLRRAMPFPAGPSRADRLE